MCKLETRIGNWIYLKIKQRKQKELWNWECYFSLCITVPNFIQSEYEIYK